jgi:hypothetical protein
VILTVVDKVIEKDEFYTFRYIHKGLINENGMFIKEEINSK